MFAVDIAAAIAAAIAVFEVHVDPALEANPTRIYLSAAELARWRTAAIELLALELATCDGPMH